jgi:hypothetical protein
MEESLPCGKAHMHGSLTQRPFMAEMLLHVKVFTFISTAHRVVEMY